MVLDLYQICEFVIRLTATLTGTKGTKLQFPWCVKQPFVLKRRLPTFGNPELDSKHALGLDCRSQGRSFNHVAHSQGSTRHVSALHQQPDNEG